MALGNCQHHHRACVRLLQRGQGRPGKGLVSRPTTAPLLWRKLADNLGSLKLVSPYLILTRGLRRRLKGQRRQGVDIEILTNSLASTDVPLVYGAYRRHRPWLERQPAG